MAQAAGKANDEAETKAADGVVPRRDGAVTPVHAPSPDDAAASAEARNRHRDRSRLHRQLLEFSAGHPRGRRLMERLLDNRMRCLRIPTGILLILGGVLSILPVLGLWMLPMGFMLMAVDVPVLRRPASRLLLAGKRRWRRWRRPGS